jgi:AbrB family looped-hinge helix DNA binding protein
MKSKITSKFQTTIPKEVRSKMKLGKNDSLEWEIEEDKVTVKPVKKPFLNYKGYIKVGEGNIKEDIRNARAHIAEKNK